MAKNIDMGTWQNIKLTIGILAKGVTLTLGKISLEGKVSFNELAPFSSDKIRAKILDLDYGGARTALHNLSPKSLLGFYRC